MKTFTVAILLGFLLQTSSHAGEARFFRIAGPVPVTITACSADGYVTWTNTPTNATITVQTARSLTGPSNWIDYVQVPVTNPITTHRLFDLNLPSGMVFIPAGSFTMGNCMDAGEGYSSELPLHTVNVSGYYMDNYKVTKALWDEVYQWAITNGYRFDNAGSGKAPNHPVQSVFWYDMVTWCNARSQKEGLVPCYYTDAGLVTIYKTGRVRPYVKWNANGFRLPTEAEWEKAARGGSGGHRFPWSDTDTIQHSRANYRSSSSFVYDTSPTLGHHPTFNDGVFPYTSPVGYFAANGYGLHDIAGNVWEWCWDLYQGYWYSQPGATQNDTRGPVEAWGDRVLRGGNWFSDAFDLRCASRSGYNPGSADTVGFRCVRGF